VFAWCSPNVANIHPAGQHAVVLCARRVGFLSCDRAGPVMRQGKVHPAIDKVRNDKGGGEQVKKARSHRTPKPNVQCRTSEGQVRMSGNSRECGPRLSEWTRLRADASPRHARLRPEASPRHAKRKRLSVGLSVRSSKRRMSNAECPMLKSGGQARMSGNSRECGPRLSDWTKRNRLSVGLSVGLSVRSSKRRMSNAECPMLKSGGASANERE
jgi:hypothetical protein